MTGSLTSWSDGSCTSKLLLKQTKPCCTAAFIFLCIYTAPCMVGHWFHLRLAQDPRYKSVELGNPYQIMCVSSLKSNMVNRFKMRITKPKQECSEAPVREKPLCAKISIKINWIPCFPWQLHNFPLRTLQNFIPKRTDFYIISQFLISLFPFSLSFAFEPHGVRSLWDLTDLPFPAHFLMSLSIRTHQRNKELMKQRNVTRRHLEERKQRASQIRWEKVWPL